MQDSRVATYKFKDKGTEIKTRNNGISKPGKQE